MSKALYFRGRATRREYWWFFVADMLVILSLGAFDIWRLINNGAVLSARYYVDLLNGDLASLVPVHLSLFVSWWALLTLIPRIALQVRRLHDIGFPGVFWFINFVPVVGWFIFSILALLPSQTVTNKWGRYPYAHGLSPSILPDETYDRPVSLHSAKQLRRSEAERKAEVRALYQQRVLAAQR